MKKTILVLLFCCLFLTSCGLNINIGDFFESKPYDPKEISADDHPFAVETMEEVIRCLDEEDSEALKKLLSQDIRDRKETDREIAEIMHVYDGIAVTYDDIRREIVASHSRDGQYIHKCIGIDARNLITDTDFHCMVVVHYILVDEDSNKIGVYAISIKNDDGVNMCAVNSLNKN